MDRRTALERNLVDELGGLEDDAKAKEASAKMMLPYFSKEKTALEPFGRFK